MKFRIAIDGGEEIELQLQRREAPSDYEYVLEGVESETGAASVVEVRPDIFSVLLGTQSLTVYLAKNGEAVEVSVGNVQRRVTLTDARDRQAGAKASAAGGPVEIRSLMPGKIIKVLVEPGAAVASGQGLVVIEAMKMQNEMKSPKDGVVAKIQVSEGATVVAGETLVVIE